MAICTDGNILPSMVSVTVSMTQQFTWNGAPIGTWGVVETGGGSITQGGLYTASSAAGTYHISYVIGSCTYYATVVVLSSGGGGGGGGNAAGAVTGFKYVWRKRRGRPTPHCIGVLVGKNTRIFTGNPLVLTISSDFSTGAVPVARALNGGDTISNQNGLIGIALFDLETDANGKLKKSAGSVMVDQKGRVLTSSFTNDLPLDPITGFLRIPIASFDDDNIFLAQTDVNQVANFYDVGRAMGIKVTSTTTFPIDPTVSAGAACLMVEGVETEDAKFNSPSGGGGIYVRCLPTFYARNIPNGFFTT